MAEAPYDFAVFGSTPLAALLAGLLATVHARRVCLVGDWGSAFRLPRSADLSVMPVTRPETWSLLKQTTPETARLLKRLKARAGMQRVDPIFVAETARGADALAHMRHVALAHAYAVERLPDGSRAGGIAYRLRDAILLHRADLEPALGAWLEQSGVAQFSRVETTVNVRRDGTALLDARGRAIEAAHAVLADDAAILEHVAAAERDRTLLLQPATAVLTEPTGSLIAPVMLYVDRQVTLLRGRSGGVIALGAGAPEQAMARIGGCLAGRGPLRRAGQRVFRAVATVDGAPLIGTARGGRATVLAGLGISGAFFAPALARLIAGVASESEKAYFGAREAGRGNARALVAEFSGGEFADGEAAA